jgi:hypothetical protein
MGFSLHFFFFILKMENELKNHHDASLYHLVLTILVLQNEGLGIVCVCVCVGVVWVVDNAYAAIGKNLNMETIIPRTLLHKSRSFFERANKNRQKKTTTRSFVN